VKIMAAATRNGGNSLRWVLSACCVRVSGISNTVARLPGDLLNVEEHNKVEVVLPLAHIARVLY
jgi:hypothetical protein